MSDVDNSYIRPDGARMVEVSPGQFVAKFGRRGERPTRVRGLTQDADSNEDRAYFYLLDAGDKGMIADEAIAVRERENGDGKPAVNQVAPVFSSFKKNGLTICRGRRKTRLGSVASVHILVADAASAFELAYGRLPSLARAH